MLKKIFDLIISFKEKIVMNLRLFDTLILFSRVTQINNNNFYGNDIVDKHLEKVLKIQYEQQQQKFISIEQETKTEQSKPEIVDSVAG
jgi:hypothetical protein